ncbi:substrate-binding domain-containing protein [Polaromonas naphthalenivorans]|uniref:Transcriptional regulator of molybdate metabolism, LysR family n=1 Tax=Polaromonas naphthalenivorans (strain CJ2) TaxID=365044 RepID=A1VME4_POLNA|nr:substrate-binding domain-containing protein [Polaromonas naphthalenivorans]ABM36822.1 transcriptional regulator of molybdate metabolism, LysR family [Polaromonas naphthalenivorans CJ2]
MHKVQLSYLLTPERGKDALIRNPMMDMLHAVSEQGSISKAARALDLSYRHVWGSLKDWEQALGRSLIVWDKGQRARLTEFGAKLLWAERQAQARLAPQIEALRGDIERAFATAFDDSTHVLTLYASHDAALSALREQASQRGLHLDIRFMGSVDAIAALNAGRCMMAGFHVRDQPQRHSAAAQTYRSLLKPGLHKLIGFAHRQQGLIVAKNNPLQIEGLADVAQPGMRYVNRPEGTGTRVLLDDLLAEAGLSPADLQGYGTLEPSHTAVAQAVASGAADAGLGIEAAAREKGLGFVPLAQERYHLVCLKSELPTAQVQALLKELQGGEWQATLDRLPGYSGALAQSGKVLSLRAALPWWSYRREKRDDGSAHAAG